jgi:transcriptional regulator with XRE-family HTH domain
MTGKYSDRYKKIGQKIKYYRRRKGLTQQELADEISISLSYLTKIEAQNCDKPFSLEVLFEVSDALNIPVTCLLEDI